MLQTAKLFARRGSSLDTRSKRVNGLTFGEFCVLAADLKRFRTHNFIRNSDDTIKSSLSGINGGATTAGASTTTATTTTTTTTTRKNTPENGFTKNENSIDGGTRRISDVNAPEVFLGGSCNPTTWRADVAIPALNKLGISFYNPVSLCSHFFTLIAVVLGAFICAL